MVSIHIFEKFVDMVSVAGCAGLPASQAGAQGCAALLPGGGACQESEEEQADPTQPSRYPS